MSKNSRKHHGNGNVNFEEAHKTDDDVEVVLNHGVSLQLEDGCGSPDEDASENRVRVEVGVCPINC